MSLTEQEDQELVALKKSLSDLSVMQMAKLKAMLEEEWGVKAATGGVAVVPAPQDADAGEKEDATEFDVYLLEAPADKKIALIKAMRAIDPTLLLKDAKEFVERSSAAERMIKEKASKEEFDSICEQIKQAGGKAGIKP